MKKSQTIISLLILTYYCTLRQNCSLRFIRHRRFVGGSSCMCGDASMYQFAHTHVHPVACGVDISVLCHPTSTVSDEQRVSSPLDPRGARVLSLTGELLGDLHPLTQLKHSHMQKRPHEGDILYRSVCRMYT